MNNDIKLYLDEFVIAEDITEKQKQFFIGWCKEGGEEFIRILEMILSQTYIDGFAEGSKEC